jgi:3-carboxy-cis,cis-muconate cycloisomerase
VPRVDPPSPPAGLFSGLFAHGAAAAQASDGAVLQAMVDVELALVRALVRAGLEPADAETDLAKAADASVLDLEQLGRSTADKGTPVPALVAALRERLGDSDAGRSLHRGATSQDIVDTAIMLVARRALLPLLADLERSADRCAALAQEHRHSIQAGRTLLQQAVPTTFGLKAAGWLTALDAARTELELIREQGLAVQLGGAVGTLGVLGDRGLEVAANLAGELELAEPEQPWHTSRFRPARLACGLGLALGAMAKIARDIVLLAQTEVAELSEGGAAGWGRSSTMPHKHNPVGSVAVLACAQRGPGLVATILSAMGQEYERAAGAWQAEWEPLLELLRLAGSAAASLRELLDGVHVHAERMRANLGLTHGLLMSESAAAALAPALGRSRAQELVEAAARQAAQHDRSLEAALLELPEVTGAIDRRRLEQALQPENYLGVSGPLIDRALEAHRDRRDP